MFKALLLTAVLTGFMFSLNFDETMEKLTDNVNSKLKTFCADVTQEIKIADMAESRILKGEVTIKNPDKIFIKFTAPDKQDIISDGKTLWIYLKEQNQVIIQKVSSHKGIDNSIFQLPKFLEYLKKKYNGSIKPEENNGKNESVLLEFAPKNDGEDFTGIKLRVDKEKWLPLSSTVYMGEGNSIAVYFYNIKTNEKIEDFVFDFKLPEGAEKITSMLD